MIGPVGKRDIDRAIEDLSDDAYEALGEQALSSWHVKAVRWLSIVCFFAAVFAYLFALHWIIRAFWPGSYIAAGIATACWILAFWYGMRALLSLRFSNWLVDRAMRREFKRNGG